MDHLLLKRSFSREMLIFSFLLFFTYVNGEIEQHSSRQSIEAPPSENKETIKAKDCMKSYSSTCLKLDMVAFLDKISEQKSLGILPGVSVVKENNSNDIPTSEIVANLARDFPNDMDKRLDAYILHKVGTYLDNHSISIKLFDSKIFEATRAFNDETLSQFGWFGNSNIETGI